ncbi:GPN-loop GTPase 3 [Trichinella pseudospiralis]|uniref:GPN-loop GTPase 3 n=1 Tax=Trichinella pseudospiralis TaxID=6337 RepID=A0A0V1EE13_TRIPS|nr:GPN-loop GTPase 3 [Trichinella pseudospiralis]KRZ37661.1 GPN-loop GTPase 3 [Trichinella pseudospiralis]
MKYGQFVIGPAGSGKSTYCKIMYEHGLANGRNFKVVNLDPAAEAFKYPCYLNIADLISLEDTSTDADLNLGPNGGLVFCMEYLSENLDWLTENLAKLCNQCKTVGQIELYTHVPVMRKVVNELARLDFRLCTIFALDTQFLLDSPKFISGSLVALSTMLNLELPHVNVLTKVDLLDKKQKKELECILEPGSYMLRSYGSHCSRFSKKYQKLTDALISVIDEFSLIRYMPLDITDEESITDLSIVIDNCIQFGEDAEVNDNYPEEREADFG